jgi:hypothetical protein
MNMKNTKTKRSHNQKTGHEKLEISTGIIQCTVILETTRRIYEKILNGMHNSSVPRLKEPYIAVLSKLQNIIPSR